MQTSRLDGLFQAAMNRQNFDRRVSAETSPASFRSDREMRSIGHVAALIGDSVGMFMTDKELSQATSLLYHAASQARQR